MSFPIDLTPTPQDHHPHGSHPYPIAFTAGVEILPDVSAVTWESPSQKGASSKPPPPLATPRA